MAQETPRVKKLAGHSAQATSSGQPSWEGTSFPSRVTGFAQAASVWCKVGSGS